MTKNWCQIAEEYSKERKFLNEEYLAEVQKINTSHFHLYNSLKQSPKWLLEKLVKEHSSRLELMQYMQGELLQLLAERYNASRLTAVQEGERKEGYNIGVAELKLLYTKEEKELTQEFQGYYQEKAEYEARCAKFRQEDFHEPSFSSLPSVYLMGAQQIDSETDQTYYEYDHNQ